MTKLEKDRLDDFKKVLTYHIVSKIHYSFKDKYKVYYEAPKLWSLWRNHKVKYENKIYGLIIKFNSTGLTAKQVQHIFGKDEDMKYLNYANIIESDNSIKIFDKGTICMNGRRFQLCKRYVLEYQFIENIFLNDELKTKVLDASSDYYTPRQRRLIFTQINKQKNYHYKTKDDIVAEQKVKDEEERINKMVEELDLEGLI